MHKPAASSLQRADLPHRLRVTHTIILMGRVMVAFACSLHLKSVKFEDVRCALFVQPGAIEHRRNKSHHHAHLSSDQTPRGGRATGRVISGEKRRQR